ncbi:MAG TPA: response regulator, partial [Vicinamibacterales bacterium]|nr:response regulator [Vicinamibacterales bacterium]
AATQTRIFEPFFTTKGDAGTGLGLATVYGLIKQHQGFITVTSAPGCGTTFEIRLPCVGAETACVTAPPSARSHRARGGDCVLVVEDDERVRQLVSRALRARGYTVFEAGDAENAVGLSRADLTSCHLLVSDVVLPRMDGRALAEEMRRINPGIAIVLMSGYLDVPIGNDAHFLRKPFTPNDLLIKVGDALRSVRPCAH